MRHTITTYSLISRVVLSGQIVLFQCFLLLVSCSEKAVLPFISPSFNSPFRPLLRPDFSSFSFPSFFLFSPFFSTFFHYPFISPFLISRLFSLFPFLSVLFHSACFSFPSFPYFLFWKGWGHVWYAADFAVAWLSSSSFCFCASTHPTEGIGGVMFPGCPSVRACVLVRECVLGWRHSPTGLPSSSS